MPEVDAQTIRDATEARIGAEQAQETAEEAQRAAEWTGEDLVAMREQLGRLEERVSDQEVVTAGVITYLAEEEKQPEPEPEPAHSEVEPRQGSKPEDREPEPEPDDRHAGTLW